MLMSQPAFNYNTVVFDCDGIILRSNRIKSDAFSDALPDEPDNMRTAFVAWHKANGGISRFAKFHYYFTVMAPRPDPDPYIDSAILRYGDLVKQRLITCDTGPGLDRVLSLLTERGIACSVNSGGSEMELHYVFAARGLDGAFQKVYGSPADKYTNMQRLREAGLLGGRGLMIGDSRSDFLAARKYGLDFAYVTLDSEWENGPAEMAQEMIHGNVFTFTDLHAIADWIVA